ncbi:AraC family transcriptional regulator [Sphingomonas pokkalii]|uniref:AraC family transcriptional regulator n=1 Tax=Sphingomonas pokkalii TaxID=2175090 RepID=A0A2U0SHM2_9SPHN|nr:AraC family transcriptional regulator [Sphingomonas pokkalii]PVX30847.1 AraC family transcriptional regulator [Sphingomonas pokkalii]
MEHSVPENVPAAGREQATIRLLFLSALIDALPDVGARIEPLLRDHGFLLAQMATPYERAPLHRYIALLEKAAERFDRPFLGLEMGTRFGLAELGPFYALLRAAGTLRGAFALLALFQSRLQTRTLFDPVIDEEVTTYSYRIEDPAIWPRRQDAEFTMAGMTTLARQLVNARWAPVAVHFEHAVKGREAELARTFRAPVHGGRIANQLVIRNCDLDRPFPNAVPTEDGKLRAILEVHLLDLIGADPAPSTSLVAQAVELIERRLGRMHVDCASLAAEFGLSERSFRRRLMEEGTSFRALLQAARQARACAMLRASDMPIAEAAQQLGYSDTATFSRAFKDWTGMSPGQYSKAAP